MTPQDLWEEALQNGILKDHVQQEGQRLPRALRKGVGPPLSRLLTRGLRCPHRGQETERKPAEWVIEEEAGRIQVWLTHRTQAEGSMGRRVSQKAGH